MTDHTQMLPVSLLERFNPFYQVLVDLWSSAETTVSAFTFNPQHFASRCIANSRPAIHAIPKKQHIIPASNLAAQVHIRGQTPAIFAQQPISSLAPGYLLVHLSYSGLCATDYATYSGTLGESDGVTGFVSPHVGGHEGIGTVVAMGSTMTTEDLSTSSTGVRPDIEQFQIGQRVGVRWMSKICEECTYCQLGRGDLCAFQKVTSVHEHGTFQQFCRVHASCAVRIPDTVSSENAAAMMCAGSTAHTAVKQLTALIPTKKGTVVIIGAGGSIGHMVIEFARLFGFDVIAVDKGPEKRELCLQQGASQFFDATTSSSQDIISSILKSSTKEGHAGVEGVIVASGGSIEPFHMALDVLRPLGVIMLLGNPSPENYMKVNVPMALIKNIKIVSTLMSGTKDCEEALMYLATGKIHPKLAMRPFVDLNQALKDVKAGNTLGKVILRIPQIAEVEANMVHSHIAES